ncbi:MAG: hypothetical protein IT585_00885 [candidate division Zixibacteria bacterium]|nr:hypothetical protein [candidate division Zixibacteria bacterium]
MSGKRKPVRRPPSDLEVLEEIQAKIVEELRAKEINPRVGDLLKALELKLKLKLSEQQKEKIWELINQLRAEELPADEPSSADEGE